MVFYNVYGPYTLHCFLRNAHFTPYNVSVSNTRFTEIYSQVMVLKVMSQNRNSRSSSLALFVMETKIGLIHGG